MGKLISGGIDTSRYSLRFALLHMAAYPDIQEKVQAEIDSVIGMLNKKRILHECSCFIECFKRVWEKR